MAPLWPARTGLYTCQVKSITKIFTFFKYDLKIFENVFIYFSWKSGNFVINDGHSLWGQLVSQKPHIFGRWTFLPLLYFCSIWPVLMKDLRKQQLLWNIYILTKRGLFATIAKSLATQRSIYPYVSIWQNVHLSRKTMQLNISSA